MAGGFQVVQSWDEPVDVYTATFNVANGATFNSGAKDMGQFAGYALTITSNTATGSAAKRVIHVDWAGGASGNFLTNDIHNTDAGGDLYVSGKPKGRWLTISFEAGVTPGNENFTIVLTGFLRPLPEVRKYVSPNLNQSGLVSNNMSGQTGCFAMAWSAVNTGTKFDYPYTWAGMATFHLWSASAVAMEAALLDVVGLNRIVRVSLAGAGDQHATVQIPSGQVIVHLICAAVSTGSIVLSMNQVGA